MWLEIVRTGKILLNNPRWSGIGLIVPHNVILPLTGSLPAISRKGQKSLDCKYLYIDWFFRISSGYVDWMLPIFRCRQVKLRKKNYTYVFWFSL